MRNEDFEVCDFMRKEKLKEGGPMRREKSFFKKGIF